MQPSFCPLVNPSITLNYSNFTRISYPHYEFLRGYVRSFKSDHNNCFIFFSVWPEIPTRLVYFLRAFVVSFCDLKHWVWNRRVASECYKIDWDYLDTAQAIQLKCGFLMDSFCLCLLLCPLHDFCKIMLSFSCLLLSCGSSRWAQNSTWAPRSWNTNFHLSAV